MVEAQEVPVVVRQGQTPNGQLSKEQNRMNYDRPNSANPSRSGFQQPQEGQPGGSGFRNPYNDDPETKRTAADFGSARQPGVPVNNGWNSPNQQQQQPPPLQTQPQQPYQEQAPDRPYDQAQPAQVHRMGQEERLPDHRSSIKYWVISFIVLGVLVVGFTTVKCFGSKKRANYMQFNAANVINGRTRRKSVDEPRVVDEEAYEDMYSRNSNMYDSD